VRRKLKLLLFVLTGLAGASIYVLYPPSPTRLQFPGGKRFALSIVDDTDLTTLERIKPLYDLLHESGLRTTKTVWVFESNDESNSTNRGATLRDPSYRQFVIDLRNRGFEVALHGVRGGSSLREDVVNGLEEFRKQLGQYPRLHVNHSLNKENMYWGQHRWSFPVYRWGLGMVRPFEFSGHNPDSAYFWGDVAKRHIKYVRRFTFNEINVLRVNPTTPYRVAGMPYVNYWFDASNGGSIDAFDELLKSENLDRLEWEGGVALVYAHLGAGSFNRDGGVDPRFVARIKDLASRNGWFAPASEILDHLAQQPGWTPELSFRERVRLETLSLETLLLRDAIR